MLLPSFSRSFLSPVSRDARSEQSNKLPIRATERQRQERRLLLIPRPPHDSEGDQRAGRDLLSDSRHDLWTRAFTRCFRVGGVYVVVTGLERVIPTSIA